MPSDSSADRTFEQTRMLLAMDIPEEVKCLWIRMLHWQGRNPVAFPSKAAICSALCWDERKRRRWVGYAVTRQILVDQGSGNADAYQVADPLAWRAEDHPLPPDRNVRPAPDKNGSTPADKNVRPVPDKNAGPPDKNVRSSMDEGTIEGTNDSLPRGAVPGGVGGEGDASERKRRRRRGRRGRNGHATALPAGQGEPPRSGSRQDASAGIDRVSGLLAWFCGQFERSRGFAFMVVGDRDVPAMQSLAETYTDQQIHQAALAMLEHPKPFVRHQAGVAFLAGHATEMLSRAAKRAQDAIVPNQPVRAAAGLRTLADVQVEIRAEALRRLPSQACRKMGQADQARLNALVDLAVRDGNQAGGLDVARTYGLQVCLFVGRRFRGGPATFLEDAGNDFCAWKAAGAAEHRNDQKVSEVVS